MQRIRLCRRAFVGGSTSVLLVGGLPIASAARDDFDHQRSHGLSVFKALSYPANFKHLNYVNPEAPKSGLFSTVALGTFNSLNNYILRGDAADGMDTTFATLMARAHDEPDAVYALAAQSVSVGAGGEQYKFTLRDGITFHDGNIITAEDIAFSLNTLKEKAHPDIRARLRDLQLAEPLNDREIAIQFSAERARDAPVFVATLPIFSKQYYLQREFGETSLDVPIGSGPYRVGRFTPGRFIEFDRVRNWWGENLPIMRGRNNFDTVRFEYFRDRNVAFEAFSAKGYVFREELNSRTWATGYDLPAVRLGQIKRETLPDGRISGGQGWAINTRRKKFSDQRVREALILAFDFEWINKNIMYGAYRRAHSCFENSEFMAAGKPSGGELSLLAPFRGRAPSEIFEEPWSPPTTDGSGQDRRILLRASNLLSEAGWTVEKGIRVDHGGKPLSMELLYTEGAFEPIQSAYIKNLAVLGIQATQKKVDPAQFQRRIIDFDFDLVLQRIIFTSSPGDSLAGYFSSENSNTSGTSNYSGIADPNIDTIIRRAIAADDQQRLTDACRALDRLLRIGHYRIAHWYKPEYWIAYWDVLRRPAATPRFARGAPETWWYDAEKATGSK